MKLQLIKLLDWLDDKIIGHRIPWLCDQIAWSPWWDDGADIWLEDDEERDHGYRGR